MSVPSLLLVDSHAHLDMPEFDADREEVVLRAEAAGVGRVLCPAELASPASLPAVLNLLAAHPRFLAAAGVHPHEARAWGAGSADALRRLAAEGRIAAVGEIGLDFHYNLSPPDAQRKALRDQLLLAGELGLPAVIHSRLAGAEVVAAVREAKLPRGGVLHCFTEDRGTAAAMMDLGFLVSFSGILTFPKAAPLREVARGIPLDRLLVETDAPFLAPVPHRAKRNEPAFVVETARILAGLKGLALEELAAATTRNFEALFGGARAGSA